MDAQRYPALRSQFETLGFVHVPCFFSPQEVTEAHSNIERYIRDVVPGLESLRALYDVDGERRAVKHLVDMDKADGFFESLLHGEKSRSLASALLGEEALPQSLEFFDKGPRIGKPTPAHQDGFYFCLKPNHALTLWVALDDCDLQNGCMSYVIGSHQRGVIDHQPSGVVGFSQGLERVAFSPDEVFVAKGKAGDCFAHHSLTIHLAGANTSDRHRRSIGLVFYAISALRDEEAFARYKANVAAQRKEYPVGSMK